MASEKVNGGAAQQAQAGQWVVFSVTRQVELQRRRDMGAVSSVAAATALVVGSDAYRCRCWATTETNTPTFASHAVTLALHTADLTTTTSSP